MCRKRESRRMGQVILLSLATPGLIPLAGWALDTDPLTVTLLIFMAPFVFLASLLFFGWLLVGPYKPYPHQTVTPSHAPPMPARPAASSCGDRSVPSSRLPAPAAAAPRSPTIKPVTSRR